MKPITKEEFRWEFDRYVDMYFVYLKKLEQKNTATDLYSYQHQKRKWGKEAKRIDEAYRLSCEKSLKEKSYEEC